MLRGKSEANHFAPHRSRAAPRFLGDHALVANPSVEERLNRLEHGLVEAVKVSPQLPDIWAELGNTLVLEGSHLEAIAAYRTSLKLSSEQATVLYNLTNALAETEQFESAGETLASACRLMPHKPLWRLKEMLHCPSVFSSSELVDEYRAGLLCSLERTLEKPPKGRAAELVNMGFYPPFQLSFQGRDHRPIKEKFAELYRNWVTPLDVIPRRGKRRIGFIVTRGHEGIFLRCCAGLIEGLDPHELDVLIFCPDCSEVILRNGIQSTHVQFEIFRDDLKSAVETIARAGCHVLYHWEIGTDALNYALPFYRLAPCQVTAWGTQVTSGMREVDYYLSSKLIESDDAQRFYTEELFCFQTLPTYQRRLAPVQPVPRGYFKLPDDCPVYLCAQSILKLHPDHDELFAEILRRDPQGIVVIKEGKHERPNRVLRERLAKVLGSLTNRCIFIPWQSYVDYLRLLNQADVVLDTHYFSAGSTTYDLFSYNLPVVTWPGIWNTGRYTLACYKKMQLMELVADSPQSFVESAVAVAQDTTLRAGLVEKLRMQTQLLFDDHQAIQEHQEFFLQHR